MNGRRQETFSPHVLRAHRPKLADMPVSSDSRTDEPYLYERQTEEYPRRSSWLQRHVLHIGLGMLLTIMLYSVLAFVVVPFITDKIDHWNFGEHRISQYDFDVGHNGTSHFLAQYWQHKVIVIEIPGNDYTQTKVYVISVIAKQDTALHVVTLGTAAVNPHGVAGKPDVVVSVSGFEVPFVLYNTGSAFSTGGAN